MAHFSQVPPGEHLRRPPGSWGGTSPLSQALGLGSPGLQASRCPRLLQESRNEGRSAHSGLNSSERRWWVLPGRGTPGRTFALGGPHQRPLQQDGRGCLTVGAAGQPQHPRAEQERKPAGCQRSPGHLAWPHPQSPITCDRPSIVAGASGAQEKVHTHTHTAGPGRPGLEQAGSWPSGEPVQDSSGQWPRDAWGPRGQAAPLSV